MSLRLATILSMTFSLALSGCESLMPAGMLIQASSKSEPAGLVSVITSVSLGKIAGPPQDVSDRIVERLDAVSRRDGIALLNYETEDFDYRLQCVMRLEGRGRAVRLHYAWYLFDRNGDVAGRASGVETYSVSPADSDLWSQIAGDALERIADQGMEAVVNRR